MCELPHLKNPKGSLKVYHSKQANFLQSCTQTKIEKEGYSKIRKIKTSFWFLRIIMRSSETQKH